MQPYANLDKRVDKKVLQHKFDRKIRKEEEKVKKGEKESWSQAEGKYVREPDI